MKHRTRSSLRARAEHVTRTEIAAQFAQRDAHVLLARSVWWKTWALDPAATVNKERLIEASLEELPVDDKDRCVPQLEQASAETQESALRDANIYLVCESVHYECLERRDRLGMCVLSEYEKTLQGNLGRFGQWCLLC